MEAFNEIELDENEIQEALRAGREKKYYQLKEIEYRKKISENPFVKLFTTEELIQAFSLQFEIDQDNEYIVTEICKYFAGDTTFNGDLDKGLFLMGPVGVGKTSIMKFFMKNQRMSYRMESCREIESKFAETGDSYIFKCSGNIEISVNSDPFRHREIGFCFDDLGTESNGKHFGKNKNVMAEIILNRYDYGMPKISTHITTNLTVDAIKENYGTRVTDRMREMFNVIKFNVETKSRR